MFDYDFFYCILEEHFGFFEKISASYLGPFQENIIPARIHRRTRDTIEIRFIRLGAHLKLIFNRLPPTGIRVVDAHGLYEKYVLVNRVTPRLIKILSYRP